MIRVFHPGSGSRIWILTFYLSHPDPYPGSQILNPGIKKAPDPWSRNRIRNTGDFRFAQAVGGSVGYWLSTGAAVLRTHSMDQLSEAFMCKKEFSVYFIKTLSLKFLPFSSYDSLRICFLTHLVEGKNEGRKPDKDSSLRRLESLPRKLDSILRSWIPSQFFLTSEDLRDGLRSEAGNGTVAQRTRAWPFFLYYFIILKQGNN